MPDDADDGQGEADGESGKPRCGGATRDQDDDEHQQERAHHLEHEGTAPADPLTPGVAPQRARLVDDLPEVRGHQLQQPGGHDGAGDLGDPVDDGLDERHPAPQQHAERDGGVDVAARHRAERIRQHQQREAERERHAERSDEVEAEDRRAHGEEDEDERAEELGGVALRTRSDTLTILFCRTQARRTSYGVPRTTSLDHDRPAPAAQAGAMLWSGPVRHRLRRFARPAAGGAHRYEVEPRPLPASAAHRVACTRRRRGALSEVRCDIPDQRDAGAALACRRRAALAFPPTLPRDVPDLVGRGELLDEVIEQLRQLGAPGWLTLVGTGGVGKTRLAVEVSRRARSRTFAGTVAVRPAVVDHRPGCSVLPAIVQAAGWTEQSDPPTARGARRAVRRRRRRRAARARQPRAGAPVAAALADAAPRSCPGRARPGDLARRAARSAGAAVVTVPPLTVPPPPGPTRAAARDTAAVAARRDAAGPVGTTSGRQVRADVGQRCRRRGDLSASRRAAARSRARGRPAPGALAAGDGRAARTGTSTCSAERRIPPRQRTTARCGRRSTGRTGCCRRGRPAAVRDRSVCSAAASMSVPPQRSSALTCTTCWTRSSDSSTTTSCTPRPAPPGSAASSCSTPCAPSRSKRSPLRAPPRRLTVRTPTGASRWSRRPRPT